MEVRIAQLRFAPTTAPPTVSAWVDSVLATPAPPATIAPSRLALTSALDKVSVTMVNASATMDSLVLTALLPRINQVHAPFIASAAVSNYVAKSTTPRVSVLLNNVMSTALGSVSQGV